ncbi:MAG: acyl-CoA dehydrogenase family protein [Polyangiales bacterium]
MDLSLSEEQLLTRDSVRRFLKSACPPSAVRRAMTSSDGCDRALWDRLSAELALQAVAIPEAYGGLGSGTVELGLILEELGRSLACIPYLSSCVLAARAIQHQGTAADHARLLPSIASGARIATLAFLEPGRTWTPAAVTLEARRRGDGWTLHGEKSLVMDGQIADLFVVAARVAGTRGAEGLSLFVAESDSTGLERTSLPTLDATRRLARAAFHGVSAHPLGEPGSAASTLARTLDEGAALLACEMVGGAERSLELAVEYAKTRTQFGRAIGSFQAIKHKCADMLVAVESARSAAYWAACAAHSESDAEVAIGASVAKSYASEAYFQVTAECIQVHGGIGFTWEHDAHLYFKRARASAAYLGDASFHRARLGHAIGLDSPAARSTLL